MGCIVGSYVVTNSGVGNLVNILQRKQGSFVDSFKIELVGTGVSMVGVGVGNEVSGPRVQVSKQKSTSNKSVLNRPCTCPAPMLVYASSTHSSSTKDCHDDPGPGLMQRKT